MFERLISIDWSGAGSDASRVALRIAQWTPGGATLVSPPSKRGARSWSRNEALEFLTRELHPHKPRTAVALDFAFGLPWGSDIKVFGVTGWQAMLRSLRDLYSQHGTARDTAAAINNRKEFQGHGPYRFNEGRADFLFYLRQGVPYYRVVELVVPQAISVWYLGAGAAVGFHTITGLACLRQLLDRRDAGLVNFSVWPHEEAAPFPSHVLLEGYPAVYPAPESFGPCRDANECDAWRMLEWMRVKNDDGQLERSLHVPIDLAASLLPNSLARVQFEGWILGVT